MTNAPMAKPSAREFDAVGLRSVSVFGSTGSIGCNTVELLSQNPEKFSVDALTAGSNWQLLAKQAVELGASVAVINDESKYKDLKNSLSGTNVEAQAGNDALVEAAKIPSDMVVAAIVGAAGLKPTIEAAKRGAMVALANKECLVSAGDILIKEAEKSGASIIPVDSEHSAIFQVFDFDNPESVAGITLTASGGPFRDFSLTEMQSVTREDALNHPNWDMGAKISIDSATMMNKGLEIIEAFHLFPVGMDEIDVLVHPQSVVHSLVSYVDGSVLAQMGTPDMKTPISCALAWPGRMAVSAQKLSLADVGRLDFMAPDTARFPALGLARSALQIGKSAPTILNAANEVAVMAFLQGKIGFLQIAVVVEGALESMNSCEMGGIDDVLAIDSEARDVAQNVIKNLNFKIKK
ncbi:MAG: 1-deoxy-D-xylulose-5-phosphate reductoisomerase [Rhodospirillaceae bacterium]|nr:1-deoxy-D-xylulose-5-phosphate reductoisomerase [Rhodospirillaceae bacterium]